MESVIWLPSDGSWGWSHLTRLDDKAFHSHVWCLTGADEGGLGISISPSICSILLALASSQQDCLRITGFLMWRHVSSRASVPRLKLDAG